MNRLRWIKILLCVFAAAFVIHQIYASFYKSVTTSQALFYELEEGFDISAVVVRDETLLTDSVDGVVHYTLEDGEKVASNGTVAKIYPDEQSSLILTELSELEKRLRDVTEILRYNDVSAVDIDLFNQKVDTARFELQRGLADGNFSDTDELMNDLLTAINRRQSATGEESGLEAVKAALEKQIAALKANVSQPISDIISDSSGYFVSSVDGYESVLTPSSLEKITPAELNSISPQKEVDCVGKVVLDYTVHFAAVVSLDEARLLEEGKSYTVQTQLKTFPELSCKVTRISEPDENRKVVVVLSCKQTNSELSTLRTGTMKVITKQYNGLRVSSRALRFSNGKTGVYVLSGIQAKFVETEVLYTGDSFIICKYENTDTSHLRVYDEVIEKGSNLYDGKIVQ